MEVLRGFLGLSWIIADIKIFYTHLRGVNELYTQPLNKNKHMQLFGSRTQNFVMLRSLHERPRFTGLAQWEPERAASLHGTKIASFIAELVCGSDLPIMAVGPSQSEADVRDALDIEEMMQRQKAFAK